MVDAIGTTKFTYTDAGQLLSEDGPWASDTVTYSYSARRRASLSVLQANAAAWTQTYGYDDYNRLNNVTSPAGPFGYTYWSWATLSDRVQYLGLPGNNTEHTLIEGEFDELARLTRTTLWRDFSTIRNRHTYEMNDADQRTRQTFKDGNYVDYTYDNIGQLKTAKGWESGGSTARLQEQFGYAYDAAWNLQRRTNNALVQTFGVNSKNELTNATRSGTLTVAGLASVPGAGLSSVAVSGTGLSSGNANVYADGSWARAGATLADGNNSYTATATESSSYPYHGRTAQDSVTVNLPATNTFSYDGNGDLTNDGRRAFEYDPPHEIAAVSQVWQPSRSEYGASAEKAALAYLTGQENQLTNVYVASAWKSVFQYDAFGRRRVRKEYGWSGSAWTLTNEVRYVYDGMLVVQERDGNNLALVSYTRGNDLSGSRQGAGGIGGLLARTDNSAFSLQHSYFHCDGNGNITALVDTNGFLVARYQYDPYGNLLGMSGPLAEANTYRFSSKEWHANSGLYYYGFRYYEPNLQRWLNRDPLQEFGGINLYEFLFSDSVNAFDSFGLDTCNYGSLRDDPDLADEDPLADGARRVRDKSYQDAKNFAAMAESLVNQLPQVQAATAATGKDAMGNEVGAGSQIYAAATLIPVGRVFGWLKGLLGFGKAARGLDHILNDAELFKRWLKASHDPSKPLTAKDAKKVWDKLKQMGKTPRHDPHGHPGTKWPGPHINVDGAHIPVDPGFCP